MDFFILGAGCGSLVTGGVIFIRSAASAEGYIALPPWFPVWVRKLLAIGLLPPGPDTARRRWITIGHVFSGSIAIVMGMLLVFLGLLSPGPIR